MEGLTRKVNAEQQSIDMELKRLKFFIQYMLILQMPRVQG